MKTGLEEYCALAAEVADPHFLERYAALKAELVELRIAHEAVTTLYHQASAELERLAALASAERL